ncbi:hypothetical protein JL722_11542 [Aureococcus anophagefferens]|nr:hypothetical protein JL722_11542 [Aureococcus anophagefferens]
MEFLSDWLGGRQRRLEYESEELLFLYILRTQHASVWREALRRGCVVVAPRSASLNAERAVSGFEAGAHVLVPRGAVDGRGGGDGGSFVPLCGDARSDVSVVGVDGVIQVADARPDGGLEAISPSLEAATFAMWRRGRDGLLAAGAGRALGVDGETAAPRRADTGYLICTQITAELTRDVERTYERRLRLRDAGAPAPAPPELATDDLIDLIVHLLVHRAVSHRDASSVPRGPAPEPRGPRTRRAQEPPHGPQMETLKGWPDAPSSLVVLGAGALGFFLSNFEVANDFLLDRGRDEPRPPAKLLAPDRAAPLAPPLSAEEGVDRILAASTRSFEDAEAVLDRARRTPPASPQRAGARKQSPLLRAQNLVSDAIELPPRLPEIVDL